MHDASTRWAVSTHSIAEAVGVGILPAGVVKLGVQFTLFVAMLFLLLSAQQDPLQQAVRILPMSETAREHTAASFSEALRGVFQSALKLAVFHAVFTWLTFRAFHIHLVYVSTLASAVCAILPLVQVWMVAIPAALQLLVQVDPTSCSSASIAELAHASDVFVPHSLHQGLALQTEGRHIACTQPLAVTVAPFVLVC